MWLINTKTLELCYFNSEHEVDYAIVSHRWEEEEVSLQDLRHGGAAWKKGYAKIKKSCAIALQTNIRYMWIDTCCIDKTSSAELSEAINSMYRWYEQAKVCYAYLSDVKTASDLPKSKWFTRGWTLQELIAPKTVKFFNRNWITIGSKAGMQERITSITGIPTRILRGAKPTECSVAQRMSWAAHRVTTRPEDRAYCLMGLFEVNMPMLYGEGTKAFARLQQEIIKTLNDQSIFAWTGQTSEYSPVLASSPADFKHGAEIRSTSATSDPTPFSLTNVGLHIELPIMPYAMNTYLAILQCQDMSINKEMMPHACSDSSTTRIGILIRRTPQHRQYVRCLPTQAIMAQIDTSKYASRLKTVPILLLQQMRKLGELNDMYGYYFRTMTTEVFGHRSGWVPNCDLQSDHDNDISWSPGGTYRVACRLPEAKIDKLNRLSQYHIAEPTGKFQVLRNVKGIDLDLKFGEHGTVAAFTLRDKEAKRSASSIAFLKVGFDFDFNPVILFYGMSSKEWDLYCQSDMPYWVNDRDIGEEMADYVEMDQIHCWKTHGMCAFRGSRTSGLDVTLPHINIHLVIAEEFQDGAKKWIVDMSPLDLPFEPRLEAACDNLKDTTWQLYCTEHMAQLREAQVQIAVDLHKRFNSQTSWAELESSRQRLEDAKKRLLSCRQDLYNFQEPVEREASETIHSIIARIAGEDWEKWEEMEARQKRRGRVEERGFGDGEKEAVLARIMEVTKAAVRLEREKKEEERKEEEERKKDEGKKKEGERKREEGKEEKQKSSRSAWMFS